MDGWVEEDSLDFLLYSAFASKERGGFFLSPGLASLELVDLLGESRDFLWERWAGGWVGW